MNIIIFGGTFDPPHNGHLRIAKEAMKRLDASLIFVPAKSPRWKEPTEEISDRLEMLKLLLNSDSTLNKASISDFEINSEADINYTIDTVRHFKKLYKNDNLYLLIGADQVNQFDRWQSPEELSSLARVVFVTREGDKINEDIVKRFNLTELKGIIGGEVSSTKIRNLESIDLPESVLNYIEAHHLYYIKKMEKYLDSHRLEHSISVARTALKIAKANNLKPFEKYYIAGLLHDIGKTVKYEGKIATEFMENYYPEYIELPHFSYHQFIGEYIARNDFGIKDEEILEAIKFHCTGNKKMSTLAKVIYASDKIEPTRAFDSTFLINSCLENYEQGFLDTLIDNKKYLLSHNKDITNKLTDDCFNEYLKED